MQTFWEAVEDGGWKKDVGGLYYTNTFEGKIVVAIEQLLNDGQMYIAFYDEDENLLIPKLVIKAGK